MNNNQKVEYWRTLTARERKTAQIMYDAEMYDMMITHCCQAVEKAIKAYTAHKNITPLPIHELERLASKTDLWDNMSKEQRQQLQGLEPYYTIARYPKDIDDILRLLNKDNSAELLNITTELTTWIFGQIKNQ